MLYALTFNAAECRADDEIHKKNVRQLKFYEVKTPSAKPALHPLIVSLGWLINLLNRIRSEQ